MERSAGVVLKYQEDYLLLRYGAGHWDFPKGHVEKGESVEQAALRELKEETGLEGELIEGFSKKITYFFTKEGKRVKKEVVFFLGKTKKRKVTLSFEHNDFAWLPYKEACHKLTYDTAKEVLTKAHEWLKKKGGAGK